MGTASAVPDSRRGALHRRSRERDRLGTLAIAHHVPLPCAICHDGQHRQLRRLASLSAEASRGGYHSLGTCQLPAHPDIRRRQPAQGRAADFRGTREERVSVLRSCIENECFGRVDYAARGAVGRERDSGGHRFPNRANLCKRGLEKSWCLVAPSPEGNYEEEKGKAESAGLCVCCGRGLPNRGHGRGLRRRRRRRRTRTRRRQFRSRTRFSLPIPLERTPPLQSHHHPASTPYAQFLSIPIRP